MLCLYTGIKEDHYGGKEGLDRQRGSGGSTGSSGSSSGGEGGKRGSSSSATSKSITLSHMSGNGSVPPSPAPSGGGGGFGFMRRPSTGASNGSGSSAKYAVPVTTVSGNGKVMVGMVREQTMMTQEEYKQALAAASSASHISPYSVITTIQQQRPGTQQGVPSATQSPKTRTKVKVSGGTQTTNDLHDMSVRGGTGSAHAALYAQHHHHHQHHLMHHHHSQTLPGHGASGSVSTSNIPANNPSESEYAMSTCSRNSGSFAPSTSSSSQQIKSLSLTTPTAAQLSQSLRERILGSQSLPKGATSSADYAAILAAIQQQQHHHHQHQQIYGTPNSSRDRMSRYAAAAAAAAASNGTGANGKNLMNDGSLSDAGGYAAYSEIYASTTGASSTSGGGGASGNAPYSWMRHSTGYASSITSAPTRLLGGKFRPLPEIVH